MNYAEEQLQHAIEKENNKNMVECINNDDGILNITVGQKYELKGEDEEHYYIINDFGEELDYLKYSFKKVGELIDYKHEYENLKKHNKNFLKLLQTDIDNLRTDNSKLKNENQKLRELVKLLL